MSEDQREIERLGAALALSARSRPGFVGDAIAVWEASHPERSIMDYLRCDEGRLWRVSVTPRPEGERMVERTLELASDIGVDPSALVNILRFAATSEVFGASASDGEMLMAALDADDEGDEP